MEIDLDDIDFSQIPGYTPINSSVPNWKKDMVEKKNREKLDEYLNEMRRRKAEEEKWKNVPEWKRKLLVEKDKLKREEDEMKTTAALREQEERRRKAKEKKKVRILSDAEILERTNAKTSPEPPLTPVKEVRPIVASPEKEVKVVRPSSNIISPDPPPPTPTPVTPVKEKKTPIVSPDGIQKEDEQRRKEERKQQVDEEKMDEEECAALPAWKREIMAKRGGALRNWGDEREEENEAPNEEQ